MKNVKPVLICSNVLQRMIEHAVCEYPLECCGLLSGTQGVIDAIRPTGNDRQSSTEFSVPHRELFDFFKEIRCTRWQHLGIYHSHPDGDAFPSDRDVTEFHYPRVSYWIVSLNVQKPNVRCYLWEGDSFHEALYEVLGTT